MLMNKIKPTHKHLELPPAISSLTFNEEGLLKKYTSFVADRSCGNTHGYSGVFGVFRGLGEDIPFPSVLENYLRKDNHKRRNRVCISNLELGFGREGSQDRPIVEGE